ncbi:MAG: methylenetetrahydrofolate reductase [Candidatus Neomarinimicrobiota bacterium]
MKVTEHIEKSNKTLFSYEIIPPMRGRSIDSVFSLIEQLIPFDPPFIDLTSRSAEVYYEELEDGSLRRHAKRKRPGTIGLSAAIKNRYNIETVPHILCKGYTKEETEDALIELNFLGINNVLAVQGDELRQMPDDKTGKTHNIFSSDLVNQIKSMNSGNYLEELSGASATDFCIGVAGYPEKHLEAPNLESDLKYLKQKVDAGADYIVTQMCFDNNKYFDFVNRCNAFGITIPIIPGIKIITRETHLKTIPKTFHIDVPEELSEQVEGSPVEKIYRTGVDWAIKQCRELIEAKVPCIHFYIMNSAQEVAEVVSTIK